MTTITNFPLMPRKGTPDWWPVWYNLQWLASQSQWTNIVGLPTPIVNGQWVKGSGGAAIWSAIAAGDLPDLSATYQAVSAKGAANGYAGLDANSRLTPAQNSVSLNAAVTISAANTDLPAPSTVVWSGWITTGGGSLRSIGAGLVNGARITLWNNSGSNVTILNSVTGGSGAYLVMNRTRVLVNQESIELTYDGVHWVEVAADVGTRVPQVAGLVNANGTVGAGVGYTLTHTANSGIYTITTTSLNTTYGHLMVNAAQQGYWASGTQASNTTYTVWVNNPAGPVDAWFYFTIFDGNRIV